MLKIYIFKKNLPASFILLPAPKIPVPTFSVRILVSFGLKKICLITEGNNSAPFRYKNQNNMRVCTHQAGLRQCYKASILAQKPTVLMRLQRKLLCQTRF